MIPYRRWLFLALLGGAAVSLAQNGTDHAAVTSYPGSVIRIHRQLEFEPYELAVAPLGPCIAHSARSTWAARAATH